MDSKTIRIGIIGPSEIAFRRFLPALKKADNTFEYKGIAIASPTEWFGDISQVSTEKIEQQQINEKNKVNRILEEYEGILFEGYDSLIRSKDIDAVYIPLPPALHFKWAKRALEENKHVFVEKPSTTSLVDTKELLSIASKNRLALHENYMFIFHKQLRALSDVVKTGEIGDIRLYRITFGFPRRSASDFRYNKVLGGGALYDAGGYCLKYANWLLGGDAMIVSAKSNYLKEFEVDIYGSATMTNSQGEVAQIAFGMDNDYRCDIEIWGSLGTMTSTRILTAPNEFVPAYTVKKNQQNEIHNLPADDAFLESILHFARCIQNNDRREKNYNALLKQSELVEQFESFNRIN